MLKKEDLLQSLSEQYEWTDTEQQRIEEKMDEWAKQEIYGMLEWLLAPSDDYTISSGKHCFYFNAQEKTFPQMYELYLQHKPKQ